MRNLITFIVIALVCCSVSALAVPAGRTLIFKGSPIGAVTFSGDIHKRAVTSCNECHNAGMFPKMKQGTVKITMNEIYAGKLCGTCHNGKKAFDAKGNCGRCHKK